MKQTGINLTYSLITSFEQLSSLCQKLSQSSVIAVDTEFKRETTYFPIPCLFQIATDELTACIDPFKIDDLTPLKDLLGNENILKIFHAGRQDLEIFYYLFKQLPKPIFDTQVAAAILGFPAQVGYAKLVSDYIGIELDKSLTRADWEKRPLPEKQLEYAANDVIYLLQVYKKQQQALAELNRLDWPTNDCNALLNEELYQANPSTAWTRIKNYPFLTTREKRVASALSKWRETLAIERNRPRKYIFDNPVISELSAKQPTSLEALNQLKNIPTYVGRKYGKQIVEIIKEAINSNEPLDDKGYQRLTDEQNKLVKQMQQLVKQAAEKEKIDASVISSKKDLEKLVQGEKHLNVLHDWRYNLIGKRLVEMVE